MEYKIKKNGFLTFILSLLPGGGHMYLGLIKQGVELMCIFFGICFIADIIGFHAIGYLCPILVFYSVFDALSKRESGYDDKEAHCEIINWVVDRQFKPHIGAKFIGISLIVIGGLFLVNNFLPMTLNYFGITNYHEIMNLLRTGVFALLFIAGGLYIAFRQPKNIDKEEK